MSKKEYTTINAAPVSATDKAVLFAFSNNSLLQQWVPRSVIEDGDDVEESEEEDDYHIETWFAKKEGLD